MLIYIKAYKGYLGNMTRVDKYGNTGTRTCIVRDKRFALLFNSLRDISNALDEIRATPNDISLEVA
jgi:hypothetical protein